MQVLVRRKKKTHNYRSRLRGVNYCNSFIQVKYCSCLKSIRCAVLIFLGKRLLRGSRATSSRITYRWWKYK